MKVPSPGESINKVEVSSLLVDNGSYVLKNQNIAEIESDKATLEIVAEENGKIKFTVKEGEYIKVGDILCTIDTSYIPKKSYKLNNVKNNISYFSDNKISSKYNDISIKDVFKTNKEDGEIIKNNILKITETKKKKNKNFSNREFEVFKLSNIRKKISERLVSVKNETAMLTTFNEVDMTEVLKIKNNYNELFKQKHGVSLGFMSFFTKACVKSLFLYPDINSIIEDGNKITFKYCDISIAISSPKGLMTPVLRNCENLSFREIEQGIKNFSIKIQNKKISIDDMNGGTFTISNGGVFGSMLSTPIINPPQSAILGMHNIVKRPFVVKDKIEIRPIMYLALSYDHRLIDGLQSVGFLMSIKNIIENPFNHIINFDINRSFEL